MNIVKKILKAHIIVILSCMIVFYSFDSGECQGKKPEYIKIKIGVIAPFTGPMAFIGELMKEGIELANDEINSDKENHGFQFEIVYSDNKGTPKDTVSIIQKNINIDKIKFFLVSPTPACMAAAPIVDKAQVIMFAGSTHPYITDKSRYIFRTCASNAEENELLTTYTKRAKILTTSVLYVEDDFGQSSVRHFEEHFSGKVISKDPYSLRNKDFRDQILRLKLKNPESYLILGYGVAFSTILKQMAELGIDKPILGNLGFSNPPVQKMLKILPQDFTERVTFSSPVFSKKFEHKIEERFSKKTNLNQAFAYDFLKIVSSEIKKSGVETNKIIESIPLINNYTGGFQSITFMPNGDSRSVVRLMKIKDGEIVQVE